MPALTSKTFTTLVGDFAAAAQGAASKLIDFTIGSILRAVGEASGGNALWLQAIAYQVLGVTRLATSEGSDVDSFVADFGLTRIAAVKATGLVTFARFTPAQQATVPVGARITSLDGSQPFLVTANPAHPNWNGAGGYTLVAGVASIQVPVQAINAGTQGNVSAGAIQLLQSALPGIDTVANVAAFTTGIDAESDADLQDRFLLFIASLSKATELAIRNAIRELQHGVQIAILNNADRDGRLNPGRVTVVIDDGSGSPPVSLVQAAQTAADAVRAGGVSVAIFACERIVASVGLTIGVAPGYTAATVYGEVTAAIAAYINGLGLNAPLRYSAIDAVAWTVPGVTNVTAVFLNGDRVDLVPAFGQTIKVGNISPGGGGG